ncbi:MAG: hypothetical protein WC924_05040 [Candidatus Gracilibacteria bacterium]
MDTLFLTGLIGSLFLVIGAAWMDPKKSQQGPKSLKNWLFAIGNILMFAYAILGYLEGNPVFFVFLESLATVSTVFMMLNANDRVASTVVGFAGLGFLAWSFYLFEGVSTLFFILGLTCVGIGFILKDNFKRNLTLVLGSVLIALFSYLGASWLFFWLNVFFSLFSAYHVVKSWRLR